jgi:hypothetical protein
MGLTLPSELVTALGWIGFNWPTSDEEKLFQLGQSWVGFSSTLSNAGQSMHSSAQSVWTSNTGAAIDAFKKWWEDHESAPRTMSMGSTASTMLGAGLFICAAAVLALKVNVIVQLVTLTIEVAQAIATAIVTFGASLAEIPLFKIATQKIVDFLLNQVINMLLGG